MAAGSAVGVLLGAAFVLLLFIALIDPTGAASSADATPTVASVAGQVRCPGNSPAASAFARANPASCPQ